MFSFNKNAQIIFILLKNNLEFIRNINVLNPELIFSKFDRFIQENQIF